MNKQKLTLPDGTSYSVLTGAGLLDRAGAEAAALRNPCRIMIVTDSNVAPLYLERAVKSFADANFLVHVHVVGPGEESKSIPVLMELLEAMAEAHLTRTDCAAALGGGVIGDLTGFAAGCYLRGIPFIQLPTTLLAAVDASVGGKTAVNLLHGKNLAGLFHQPAAVICDTDTFRSLGAHELRDGMAEAIKHGILADPELFTLFEHGEPGGKFDEIVVRSVRYKAQIVNEDPNEKGVRKLLNLGHTPAHAIERLSNFAVTHGHAVATGMAIMARASAKRGILSKEDCARILETISRNGLPVSTEYSARKMAEIAAIDKKSSGSSITVILPEKIGKCRMEEIPLSELEALFADGLEGQA